MPDASGWWFFTPRIRDWKFAQPIWVIMIGRESGELWFQRPSNQAGYDGRIKENEGWWYGPVEIPEPEEGRQGSHE
jgi:hypothetical protein